MAISIKMGLARANEAGTSYVNEFFDVQEIGLNGHYRNTNSGVELGIMLERIISEKRIDFIKTNDPIITHRLQRAFLSKKKFRNLNVSISENSARYEFDFEDIKVLNFKQEFSAKNIYSSVSIPLLLDIVRIEAATVFRWF